MIHTKSLLVSLNSLHRHIPGDIVDTATVPMLFMWRILLHILTKMLSYCC